MVGREQELERILSRLHGLAQGSGCCVFVCGEAGIGKTRLTREVLARAGAAHIRAYVGRCFEQYTRVPFFSISQVLDAVFAEVSADVQAAAYSRWPELAHVLANSGDFRALQAVETQLQVFRAVVEFIRSQSAATSLVLVVEDLHWADDTSLALLLHLGRHVREMSVLVLATYRDDRLAEDHLLESTLRELRRERLVEEIDVRRLPLAGTAALLQTRMPHESISDELTALVHSRAQGNPFFTEELLASFVDAGLVTYGVPATALAEVPLPRAVRSVVADRVGRLPIACQELLRVASVLGQEFELSVLLAVSEREEDEALDKLDTALRAGLLEVRRGQQGEWYGFTHALIQEAVYEQLPEHRRRRLHLRVGEESRGSPKTQQRRQR